MVEQERTYTIYVRETVEYAVEMRGTDVGAAADHAIDAMMEGYGRKEVEWAGLDVVGAKLGEADRLSVVDVFDWDARDASGLPGKRVYLVHADGGSSERLARADSASKALADAELRLQVADV